MWKASKRQKIIDGYLAATGHNMFVPAEFVDWLKNQPDHEAYPLFFGKGDAAAAREHRIGLARHMASGLRIVAKVETLDEARSVNVRMVSAPQFISPVSGRRTNGGGYHAFDPAAPEHMDELRRQGGAAMRSWLSRYSAAFSEAEIAPLRDIAAQAYPPAAAA